MYLKGISTEIMHRTLAVNLPDKSSIVMRGQNAEHLIYIIESLISQDFTGFYYDSDVKLGCNYKEVTGVSKLYFNNGEIIGKDRVIKINGEIPKLHCIRYTGNGYIRSQAVAPSGEVINLGQSMNKYNNSIPIESWIRLITVVNNILGFEFVTLEGSKLSFDNDTTSEWSVLGRKTVYTLVAECFLSPKGYNRVVLLSNIDSLTSKQQLSLIKHISNIRGHEVCISCGNISMSDSSSDNRITFINI